MFSFNITFSAIQFDITTEIAVLINILTLAKISALKVCLMTVT